MTNEKKPEHPPYITKQIAAEGMEATFGGLPFPTKAISVRVGASLDPALRLAAERALSRGRTVFGADGPLAYASDPDEDAVRDAVGSEVFKHLGKEQPPPTYRVFAARLMEAAIHLLRGDMVAAIGAGAVGTFEELVALGEDAHARGVSALAVAMILDARFSTGEGEVHRCYDRETCHVGCPAHARWTARVSYLVRKDRDAGFVRTRDDRPKPPLPSQPLDVSARGHALREAIELYPGNMLREIADQLGAPPSFEGETDEALRSRLKAKFLPPSEEKPKPAGFTVAVPCGSGRCGYTTVYPVGEADPKQQRCPHVFRWDPFRGAVGKVGCDGCGLAVDMREIERALEAAGMDPRRRYDQKGNALADESQRLRDENTRVLADNARLRLQIEKLERLARRPGGVSFLVEKKR